MVAIITFILLSAIFYIFGIGYTTDLQNGKIIRKFSWKYPLAITLIVWLFWHFYLYPPPEEMETSSVTTPVLTTPNQTGGARMLDARYFPTSNKLQTQRITMVNWI